MKNNQLNIILRFPAVLLLLATVLSITACKTDPIDDVAALPERADEALTERSGETFATETSHDGEQQTDMLICNDDNADDGAAKMEEGVKMEDGANRNGNTYGNDAGTANNGFSDVFSIEGTADSITDEKWDRMLVSREEHIRLAGQYRELVLVNMDPAKNVVYLTFDDGPDPVNTVRVINILKEHDVRATFFFTGENMRRHRDVVELAHAAGFSIGLHGYSHISFRDLTEEEIVNELTKSNDLLESITGKRATIMRPPYGAIGHEEIETIRNENLTIYLWSLDTLDWAQDDAGEILRNVQSYLRPGEIILMHAFSGQRLVPEILPSIIEFIQDSGYEMQALG